MARHLLQVGLPNAGKSTLLNEYQSLYGKVPIIDQVWQGSQQGSPRHPATRQATAEKKHQEQAYISKGSIIDALVNAIEKNQTHLADSDAERLSALLDPLPYSEALRELLSLSAEERDCVLALVPSELAAELIEEAPVDDDVAWLLVLLFDILIH